MTAGGEDRPGIGIAEQLVGNPLHMDEVFRIGTDTAENPENRLHEKRRLDQTTLEEMRKVVEMPDIVTLELEPRTAALSQILQNPFDIGEGVAEDEVARHLEMPRLPGMLEFLVLFQQREEPEIHRSHIERAHLGLGAQRGGEPFLERHSMSAAGRDVDDGAGGLLDPRQELHKDLGIGGGPPVLRIARMKVQDRRPGLGGSDRIARNLVRGQRQIWAHRRGMDRTRDGAGYDDLATQRHLVPPLFISTIMAEFGLQVARLFTGGNRPRPLPQFPIEPKVTVAATSSKSAADFLPQVAVPMAPDRASSSKP